MKKIAVTTLAAVFSLPVMFAAQKPANSAAQTNSTATTQTNSTATAKTKTHKKRVHHKAKAKTTQSAVATPRK